MKSKKLLTSVVALGTAAALALGGTFAWQSISQTALNERSDIVNPGGRLHNDITFTEGDVMTTNNDIYVENFADEDIFARVRLSEYMEIVMNYGNPDAEVVEVIAGSKTPVGDSTYTEENATRQDEFEYTYAVHYFDQDNATDEYWQWTPGDENSDELYYMPTFNLNKDSLVADLNGSYTVAVGGIANYEDNYEGYTEYDADSTESGTEIYDADINNIDEVGTDFDNLDQYVTAGNIKTIADVEHTAALVGTSNGLISMEEWLALNDGEYSAETHGNYWVYDTDGWVYWSSPIAADTATGLLLDSFTLQQVMDDTYYYAIHVESQFVTANDVGKANSTGFYHDADEAPSTDAETLLKNIGVEFSDTDDDDDDDIIEDIVVVINVDDDADTVSYTLTPDSYAISPVGFGETVTYTVTGAKRCKVTADDKLSVSEYESASAFTLTATDEDGSTGTVTINVTDTTPTDYPVFTIYKLVDGEEYWAGEYTSGATGTLDWTAGDTYRIKGDFLVSDMAEYYVEWWDMPDCINLSKTAEVYIDIPQGHTARTVIRAYDPDYDTDTTAEEWTGDVLDVATTDAAIGKSYRLDMCSTDNDYEGVEITVNVKARDEFFTVTDNDGDDTNNPAVVWNSSFGMQTVEYTGTATEFTFAPKDGSTGWKYAFGNAESYWSNNEDGIITIFEFGDKIATLGEDTGVVTVEAGKLLGQWAQVKAYKDSEEHYIVLNGLTNTSGAAAGATTYEPTVTLRDTENPTVISLKAGDSVVLKNEDGDALALSEIQFGSDTAEEGTDYTYEDGTLTLKGSQLRPGLTVSVYFVDGSNKAPEVWLIYEDDGKLTLSTADEDGTVVALNDELTVESEENGTVAVLVYNADDYLTENTDYTYSEGKLTITNEELKGKMLTVIMDLDDDNYCFGYVYVEKD